jgi:hypothetical protein
MSSKVEKKDIAKLLFCSSMLEEKVAKAYQSLADRVTNVQNMLRVLCDSIEKVDATELKCQDIMGEAWSNIERLAREEVYSIPVKDDLATLIKDMTTLESYIGEEYLSSTQVFLTVLAAEQSDIDISQIKNMLDWIVQDEERHLKIIQTISTMISKIPGKD